MRRSGLPRIRDADPSTNTYWLQTVRMTYCGPLRPTARVRIQDSQAARPSSSRSGGWRSNRPSTSRSLRRSAAEAGMIYPCSE